MIELKGDALVFSFPEVHSEAVLTVGFQRTLRIPDDGRTYPLPAGFGFFPLRHVDDFAEEVPASWLRRGGVMLPMYQSEALWLHPSSRCGYPFALKVGTGKIDAVTGESWREGLSRDSQDYLVLPDQPWLDGYCVEKGVVRQFVAMPLGAGYTAEEQLTGRAEHGGIQLVAYPIKAEVWERLKRERSRHDELTRSHFLGVSLAASEMGLAPGGRMRQDIYDDGHAFSDWDQGHRGRCFVHLANSMVWRAVTGEAPPTTPLTPKEYAQRRIPWFEYYAERSDAVDGSKRLAELESVAERGARRGDAPLPENESVTPGRVLELRRGMVEGQVREGTW
jgi:hypothetical protein